MGASMSQRGQSLVEYLMLMVVLTTISNSILRSDLMKNLLGPQGQLMSLFKANIEYSYRHALPYSASESDPADEDYGNFTGRHQSYNVNESETRFFVPEGAYPR